MISGANISKLLLLFCSLLLAGCFFDRPKEQQPGIQEMKGDVFGAYYIIKFRGDLSTDKFQNELNTFFSEFNNEFSTYQQNSVISSFNQLSANVPMKVSKRFIQMLQLIQKYYQETDGAFDPTLGPVIKLWGFGGGERKNKAPSEAELKQAMSQVGFHLIKWNETDLTVWKTADGLNLDVNAFAPGWVADMVGKMLESQGVTNYMVDLSGEIVFKGNKGNNRAWVTGIEKPSIKYAHGIQIAFKMNNQAIATSGNYRQFFDEQGVRKSHIIDPKTGKPVSHTIASASVISATGASADVWSTAMMVLGPKGFDLAEKNGIKVLLLDAKKPNLFDEVLSPSMERFLKDYHL